MKSHHTIFDLPCDCSEEHAGLILIPAPFDATTSFRSGCAEASQSILKVSNQVDLYHPLFPEAWKKGITLLQESSQIHSWNKEAHKAVEMARANYDEIHIKQVNTIGFELNTWLSQETNKYLNRGKKVAVIGGDHSTPFGAIKEFLGKYPHMGFLHIDAHLDLRPSYEGFEWSHASIMYNVVTKLKPACMVQVGIRDFCDEELQLAKQHPEIHTFFDRDLFAKKSSGVTWQIIVNDILALLPADVYISFDIDGLDPSLCPSTGTPVPGGLSFQEAVYLLNQLILSGRKIIGFDLNEVGAGTWDGIVASRLLYELCILTLR